MLQERNQVSEVGCFERTRGNAWKQVETSQRTRFCDTSASCVSELRSRAYRYAARFAANGRARCRCPWWQIVPALSLLSASFCASLFAPPASRYVLYREARTLRVPRLRALTVRPVVRAYAQVRVLESAATRPPPPCTRSTAAASSQRRARPGAAGGSRTARRARVRRCRRARRASS
eukprot:scaffold73363_cov60-Phaeocystis_antarctica.AAC.2